MSTHPFIAVSFLVTFEKKGSPLEGKTGQGRGLDNAPLKIGEYNFANRLSCQVLLVTNGGLSIYSYFEKGCRKTCARDNPER